MRSAERSILYDTYRKTCQDAQRVPARGVDRDSGRGGASLVRRAVRRQQAANSQRRCHQDEWINPHSRFYVDVKDDAGNVVNWNVELASPNVLLRQGWDMRFAQDRRSGHRRGRARQGRLEYGERPAGHARRRQARVCRILRRRRRGSAIRKEGAQEGTKEK